MYSRLIAKILIAGLMVGTYVHADEQPDEGRPPEREAPADYDHYDGDDEEGGVVERHSEEIYREQRSYRSGYGIRCTVWRDQRDPRYWLIVRDGQAIANGFDRQALVVIQRTLVETGHCSFYVYQRPYPVGPRPMPYGGAPPVLPFPRY